MSTRCHLTRREFTRNALTTSVCLVSALKGSSRLEASSEQRGKATADGSPTDADTLDAALEVLARSGPEHGGGLSNHGPMACEALTALARPEAVIPWLDQYRLRLQPPLREGRRIDRKEWREGLGKYERAGDWIAFFDRELKAAPWREVLSQWVPLLAPGLVGAATHGLIRTGHAARSLGRRENALRRHELAQGLAYWAARYYVLPGSSAAGGTTFEVRDALKRVHLLPGNSSAGGSIVRALRRLDDDGGDFSGVLHLLDTSGDPSRILSELTATFARVYLANSEPPAGRVIAFIHSVTGPAALRLLLPSLTPEASRSALKYGWQAAAAMYAALGNQPPGERIPESQIELHELIDRAVATRDEHAIKFTEACVRENAIRPDPAYLAAAWNAVGHLSA